MIEFIFFIIGVMLGGLTGIVIMCCLQINRSEKGENEMCRYFSAGLRRKPNSSTLSLKNQAAPKKRS